MKWLAGKAPRFDALPDKKSVWWLEIGTADARDSIVVFIDNRKAGSLSGTKTLACASLLDRLDAPAVFRGLQTGDLLWVDLLNLPDFRAYVHEQTEVDGAAS